MEDRVLQNSQNSKDFQPQIAAVGNSQGDLSLRPAHFWIYRWRLPLTATLMLFGFTLALFSRPRLMVDGIADQSIDLFGYLTLILGILIRVWSVMAIASKKSKEVVCVGPYALCRNPLYLGTFLIAVGFLCLVQSLTMTLLSVPLILVYLLGVVPVEERVMAARHGAVYEAYCQRTPRWIPKLSQLKSLQLTPNWNRGVRREMECCVWWIVIATIVHLTCDMRMESWWMHPFNLP